MTPIQKAKEIIVAFLGAEKVEGFTEAYINTWLATPQAAALLSGEDWKESVKIPEGEKVAYVPGWAALRSAVCEMLMDNINTDEPYLAIGNKTFTRSQLANEVMNGTDHGLKIMESLIKLTIDSIRRGKSTMPKNLNQ